MSTFSIILLTTAPLLVFAALLWKRFPPANINYLYGYRTFSSMRNQRTWQEANTYAPALLLKIGAVLSGAGVLGLFFPLQPLTGVVTGLALVLGGMVLLIWKTERRLSRLFDKNGELRRPQG